MSFRLDQVGDRTRTEQNPLYSYKWGAAPFHLYSGSLVALILCARLPMLSDPFTTQDGDVTLRAGSDPDPKHDFRVHRIILSFASRVFKDLFLTAKPDDGQEGSLPVVTVTDPPESMDLLLRFIYPGVSPPKVADLTTLSTLLTIADKYDVATIPSVMKERLTDEDILEEDPFGAYLIARRWGFADEAKGAARRTTLAGIMKSPFSGSAQDFFKEDFFRLLWFMQRRGEGAKETIRASLRKPCETDGPSGEGPVCAHADWETRDFYEGLAEKIIEEFDANPCMDRWDMVLALGRAKDPPHTGFCDDEERYSGFSMYCPLRPTNITDSIDDLGLELERICVRYLNEAMDGEFPS